MQENVGGTTYYYTPDENLKPTIEEQTIGNHSSQISDKILQSSLRRTVSPTRSVSVSQHQPYSVYSGPSSSLPSRSGQQRSSFFMNEDIRADLLHRNSVALATSDPSVYPGEAPTTIKNRLPYTVASSINHTNHSKRCIRL